MRNARHGRKKIKKLIRLGHSPDADDAFMFYALANNRLYSPGMEFEHVLKDIETLNKWAIQGRLEVTAMSLGAYPFAHKNYRLLPYGASVGDGYGPILVAKKQIPLEKFKKQTVAIPGIMTTAFLALRILAGNLRCSVVPFDRILQAVAEGEYDLGLVIHEGQLTYAKWGLTKVADLGEWWKRQTRLPLPLGADAVRKDLGLPASRKIGRLLEQSIQWALDHRKEAMRYAIQFARHTSMSLADRFVGMYVNNDSLGYRKEVRAGIEKLFSMARERGIFKTVIKPEFVE